MLRHKREGRIWAAALLAATQAVGCGVDKESREVSDSEPREGIVSLSKTKPESARVTDPATIPKPGGPLLGVVAMALTVYEKPELRAAEIGYLRVGATVVRGEKPVKFDTCQGGFYRILPRGYVCLDNGGTIDMNHPIMRADLKQADPNKPLPYSYAFVRAIAPRYYRLPSSKEQFQYEMSLERHLRSFRRLKKKWNAIKVGSNDVPLDSDGSVVSRTPDDPPKLTESEKFGGDGDGAIPWFFAGRRKIPNIANFKVPDYAVITNRIKRHAGVALIDAFHGDDRHFALTTDLRLIPTSKLKPGRGSVFHGVDLNDEWELPMAFAKRERIPVFRKKKGRYKRKKRRLAIFSPVQLTGNVRRNGKYRMVENDEGNWLRTRDLAIAVKSNKLPKFAKGDTKWIDVSIQRQTLTLYLGKKAVYATMVSTGRDGLGNPKTTHSTPRGTFRIRDKHLTTTMASEVVGSRFELNDVPWVQYFKAGYAVHAAYWHTDYGRPRSHGCINMSPIDAFRLFRWTDPPLPENWHGVDAGDSFGEGTRIYIHP